MSTSHRLNSGFIKRYFVFVAFLLLQIAGYAQPDNKNMVHVLTIDGFSNHDWQQTSSITKSILEESKLFSVESFTGLFL